MRLIRFADEGMGGCWLIWLCSSYGVSANEVCVIVREHLFAGVAVCQKGTTPVNVVTLDTWQNAV